MTGVSALIEKRRELARMIETLEEQLDQHLADSAHINGALRLLGIVDHEALRPKGRYRRNPHFGRNELSRLVLGILRTAAGEPIGIAEIARRVTAAKGFNPADTTLRAAIRQRLRAILTRLA
jgi:hypothetical protein